jgi:predicted LPLAT superfamily acyltransferase
MSAVDLLVHANRREHFERVLQVGQQRGQVLFDGQHIIVLLLDDLAGDLLLAAHGAMVTVVAVSSKTRSSSGMAVISFDLASVLRWPSAPLKMAAMSVNK